VQLVEVRKSKEDASVNFIFKDVSGNDPGLFEARYVRRDPKYLAVYLSSQSGCNQGCFMCHLTATNQVQFVNATLADYMMQAAAVFDWYEKHCPKARGVHFNFMARGEAFANQLFLDHGKEIFEQLGNEAVKRHLVPRFLVSTIMPKSLMGESLSQRFSLLPPEIYYSIYSLRDEFRAKWLPNAMPVHEALRMIKEYQDDRKVVVKLHWAFVKNENDSEEDVERICRAVQKFELHANIAIVRYNPYSPIQGEEPSEEVIRARAELIKKLLPASHVKVITKVGFDVKASCGMFVEPKFVKIQS